MEGLEPANLDMVLHITSVTDTPRSVAAGAVCESAPVCVCVCARTITRQRAGGFREVSDDTAGVIPPTSASNLQHEKDSVATPVPAPSHPPLPSSCPELLSQPESNPVSGSRWFQPQLPIKYTKESVFIHLCRCRPGLHQSGISLKSCLFSVGLLFLPFLSNSD